MTIEACRSCEAPILWALTTNGKRFPVDASPSTNGNLVLRQSMGVLVAELTDLFTPPGHRYVAHFATCPQAGEWRRDREARR